MQITKSVLIDLVSVTIDRHKQIMQDEVLKEIFEKLGPSFKVVDDTPEPPKPSLKQRLINMRLLL